MYAPEKTWVVNANKQWFNNEIERITEIKG